MASSSPGTNDIREILQLLLNDPRLTRYYHFDQRPERAPLRVVNQSTTAIGQPDVTAAGQRVRIATERSEQAIEISAVSIAEASAEIQFAFRVEGIAGQATFKKLQGRWSLDELSVAER